MKYGAIQREGGMKYGAIQREGAMWLKRKFGGNEVKQNCHSHG
jgi:hypothetical protein